MKKNPNVYFESTVAPSSHSKGVMGLMKIFAGVVLLLENSDVGNWLLFFLSSFTWYLFVCWSFKGIKEGQEEERDTFKLNFIFGFTTILWCRMFTWTSRNSRACRSKRLKNLWNHFWQIVNLRVCHVNLCSVGMFSWRCYKQETQYVCSDR